MSFDIENAVFCEDCGKVVEDVEEYEEAFSKFDEFLCKDCLKRRELITCFHCGETFENEGYGKCPACRRKYD